MTQSKGQMAEMLFQAVHGVTGVSDIPWDCSPLPWQKPWNNNWNRENPAFSAAALMVFPLQRSSRLLSMRYFNTAEADLIEIIIVRLGGENQDQKGLVDFLYGLFSGNQEKVLSYIPDSDKPVRQKEVADMLSMISYAEENGIKKGEKRGEKREKTV